MKMDSKRKKLLQEYVDGFTEMAEKEPEKREMWLEAAAASRKILEEGETPEYTDPAELSVYVTVKKTVRGIDNMSKLTQELALGGAFEAIKALKGDGWHPVDNGWSAIFLNKDGEPIHTFSGAVEE